MFKNIIITIIIILISKSKIFSESLYEQILSQMMADGFSWVLHLTRKHK